MTLDRGPHRRWICSSRRRPRRMSPMPRSGPRPHVIVDTLASFNIEASVPEAIPGPVVTQYLVQPGTGVKVARITALGQRPRAEAGRPEACGSRRPCPDVRTWASSCRMMSRWS